MRLLVFLVTMFLVAYATTMQLRLQHQITNKVSHNSIFWKYRQMRSTIWLIIFVVAIGAACWYCRDCFNNNARQTHVIVVPQSHAPVIYRVQGGNTQKINNNQREEKISNKIIQQYKQYGLESVQKQHVQYQNSTNPYITQKQYESRLQIWKRGDDFNSDQKINRKCGICNQIYLKTQKPRVVLNCREDDCFHPLCLSQYRQKIVTFMNGNGLYKCPTCKDTYSQRITIYCSKCRKMKTQLSLNEIPKTSKTQLQSIITTYERCHNCIDEK